MEYPLSYEDYYWSCIVFLQWRPFSPKYAWIYCLLFTTNAHFSYFSDSSAFTLITIGFLSSSLDCGLSEDRLIYWHLIIVLALSTIPVVYQFSFGDWWLHMSSITYTNFFSTSEVSGLKFQASLLSCTLSLIHSYFFTFYYSSNPIGMRLKYFLVLFLSLSLSPHHSDCIWRQPLSIKMAML